MSERGRVGSVARALGFAGLLPQVAAVLAFMAAIIDPATFLVAAAIAGVVALIYPLLILSFLGGMWWGLAMRATNEQTAIVSVAITPSLAALLLFATHLATPSGRWPLVATGTVIMLTLLVDRWLTNIGIAPDGWMRLRIPLAMGLGALTILAGLLVDSVPGAL